MPIPHLKVIFDTQNLAFDRIDFDGDQIVAVLTDTAGDEVTYTRDMLVGREAQPVHTLPPNLQEAHLQLTEMTKEAFFDLLLCHDYARWLHAQELEPGLFSLSFHHHYAVLDDNAMQFVLTDREIKVINDMMAGPLDKLERTAAPAIQVAAASNRNVLYGAIHPAARQRLYVTDRITDKLPPRSRQGFGII